MMDFEDLIHSDEAKQIFFKFLVPVFATLSALIINFLFQSFNISAFLLFSSAIAFSAWYGRILGGVVATILSSFELYYFFTRIHQSFPSQIASLIIFILEGLFITFIIDLCQRTNRISKYQEREKEYIGQIATLSQEAREAESKIRARDEFLSIASHELKTPLTSMLLQLQTILHNIRNVSLANFSVDNLLRMLESAEGQTHRLHKMINDLLNISLITTGRMDLEREKADLCEIVKEVAESFSKRLEKENVHLNLEFNGPIEGNFDKLRMAQVITNLLTNAIKYGGGKPITIRIEKIDSVGRISVSDQGLGIKDDDIKRIFARFERAENHNGIKGLGVGLYITSHIIKAHHGNISVRSKPGFGTTFVVDVPLLEK